jgi:hypothetical protein
MQEPSNYFSEDEEQLAQRARVENSTWDGSPVVEHKGTTAELYRKLPIFSRHPYRSGGEENRYKDEIRREPLELTDSQIPITTVSKAYSLVQHRDVISSTFRALQLIKKDISGSEATLLLSEYGERMHWSCQIPGFDFDPGDKTAIVLRINCLNSVDTTTILEVSLSWFRLICSNGLMFGLGSSKLRKRHIRSLDPEDIVRFLQTEFEEAQKEQGLYKSWYKTRVELERVENWLDGHVAKGWGPHAACRIWNIILRGVDGEVVPNTENLARYRLHLKPHQLSLKNEAFVPGAAVPGDNLFHVSQALSWFAGTRNTVQERLEYIKYIPSLMDALTELDGAVD